MKRVRRLVLMIGVATAAVVGVPQASGAQCVVLVDDVPGVPECVNACTVAGAVIRQVPGHDKLPLDDLNCTE